MNRIYRLDDIRQRLNIARLHPLDVLVVGATGAGKSSTLNALFEREVASVGRGWDPETDEVASYQLNEELRFWDSPGLGDGRVNDREYAKALTDTLYRTCSIGNSKKKYGLIDMVLVVLDGTSRDMGTTYRILNEVIIPNFQRDRILVAINQADMAMKGKHWNDGDSRPDQTLKQFLDDKARSVKQRIREATGTVIKMPVCYSAENDFNVEELLDLIIDNIPRKRRSVAA